MEESEAIMNALAREYDHNPNETKVMATNRIAILYSQSNGRVIIGDLFTAPIKEGLSDTENQKAQEHLEYQIKKAIKKLGVSGEQIDLSELDEEQQRIIQKCIEEIQQERKKEEQIGQRSGER